jgi:cellulose synthase/poly-beta-1,6-N-acetylglucosamine synthase-like glycosyltransferase
MVKISYAIPVCNEHEELSRLLVFLQTHKRDIDEIVVQCDEGNTTQEVWKVLEEHLNTIKVVHYPLKGDFASFKNNLKNNCSGEWIFQIDADELLSQWFIENLPTILMDNPSVQLFCLPRINTVEGLTQEHINKWRWQVNEKGWVNFPDIQTRIIQNSPKIQWVGKVHEVIYGHASQAVLPIQEEYCILHHKNIRRQEIQNTLYSMI